MLLCQISDPHIVCEGELAYGRVDTGQMLERCVRKILALPRLPDAVVATGDSNRSRQRRGIRAAGRASPRCECRFIWPSAITTIRALCRSVFPQHTYLAGEDGFVQYAVDDFDVRLVVLDTTVPGAPGGELCARRLQWLDRTLGESDRPTIIANTIHPLRPDLR